MFMVSITAILTMAMQRYQLCQEDTDGKRDVELGERCNILLLALCSP